MTVHYGSQVVFGTGAMRRRDNAIPWGSARRHEARRAAIAVTRTAATKEHEDAKQTAEDVRAALKDAVFAAAEAFQRAVRMAEALDESLAVLEAAHGVVARSPANRETSLAKPLSPREQEVLALVAAGRSNKAIAEQLYVSPNTVKSHIASLLNKFQVGSRTHLATIAVRQEESSSVCIASDIVIQR